MPRNSHRTVGLIPAYHSVDRAGRGGSPYDLLRELVHRRYVRAVVVALALAAIAGSGGMLALAIRYDVSTVAVWRYFTRPHLEEPDLTPWLRSHLTGAGLEPLLALAGATNPGGLVYAGEHGLTFHVHTPRSRGGRLRALDGREELYARLTPLYWAGDLEGLVRELSAPAVRRRLLSAGATPHEIFALQRDFRLASEPRERMRLLLAAARQVQRFTPYLTEPFALPFGEELRFYEAGRPEGRFVGVWEIESARIPVIRDEGYAHEMGRYNHFLLIAGGDESILVRDYYRGVRRDYRLTALDHPARRTTIYRLAAAPGT